MTILKDNSKNNNFDFIGRKEELAILKQLQDKHSASLVILKGRRRIGKSKLAKKFGESFKYFHKFEGIAPHPNSTNDDQLKAFSKQFSKNFKLPKVIFIDWRDALSSLAQQVQKSKTLVLLDEISWMGAKDPNFAGILKEIWDSEFSLNKNLILILCGSVSSWIEENILNNTGYVGRVSLVLRLRELKFSEIGNFWGDRINRLNKQEILKALVITGGVPKYLQELNIKENSDQNIKRLCYQEGGYLFEDFDRIFSDIFGKRSENYKKIIRIILKEKLTASDIAKKLKLPLNGVLINYLNDLEESGFIKKFESYNFKAEIFSQPRYRISDNYLRFYLKYIEPNRSQIKSNLYKFTKLDNLIGWKTILGLQFESLILNRFTELIPALNLQNETILSAESFYQTATNRKESCQVDLMIICKSRVNYLCEIKFQDQIKSSVIDDVKEKIKKIKVPKNTIIRPVLIYSGELSEEIEEADYFDKIVNVEELIIRR